MTYERLKGGDGRRRGLLADWDKWLINADDLYCRFLDRVGDSPFLYHEVASVGFLASAAAMAGFTPLAEYEVIKRGRDDKRARVDGRADFWFSSEERAYSFEFKRAYVAATTKNLSNVRAGATQDIACIQREVKVDEHMHLLVTPAVRLVDALELQYRLHAWTAAISASARRATVSNGYRLRCVPRPAGRSASPAAAVTANVPSGNIESVLPHWVLRPIYRHSRKLRRSQ